MITRTSVYRRYRRACLRWVLTTSLCVVIVLTVIDMQTHTHSMRGRLMRRSARGQYSPPTEPEFHKLRVQGNWSWTFEMEGFNYDASGKGRAIKSTMTTTLVHNFSPGIKEEVEKKFVDPAHQNVFFVNSPAIKWHSNSFVVVARIWLDKERYIIDNIKPPLNDFQDNYLFTKTYDDHLRPITLGRILGIPLAKEAQVGDGPIEPRFVRVKGRLFVTFNAAVMMPWGQKQDATLLYDYDKDVVHVPTIKQGSPAILETTKGVPRDKHWMALVQDDELYFVHNLDPLAVIKCTLDGQCRFVYEQPRPRGFMYKQFPYIGRLRGGTPFETYKDHYSISVAHMTNVKALDHMRYYTAHLVVLSSQPIYRIVHVSGPVEVHPHVYKYTPNVRAIKDGFIFPVSLVIEHADSLIIGGHVNDNASMLFRMTGVANLMNDVMAADVSDMPVRGPPAGYIRSHARVTLQNQTGVEFLQ